jgi:CheY-like chemotaxis protein
MSASRRVLLVDDDDSIREVAKLALEATLGWEVTGASSGYEAIRLAGERRFDLILLDVMMPGLDGPSTLARLTADPEGNSTPVMLITAKTLKSELAGYEKMGVAGTIQKPFDPMSLGADISRILGWEE